MKKSWDFVLGVTFALILTAAIAVVPSAWASSAGDIDAMAARGSYITKAEIITGAAKTDYAVWTVGSGNDTIMLYGVMFSSSAADNDPFLEIGSTLILGPVYGMDDQANITISGGGQPLYVGSGPIKLTNATADTPSMSITMWGREL